MLYIVLSLLSFSEGKWVPILKGFQDVTKPEIVCLKSDISGVEIQTDAFGFEWRNVKTDFMKHSTGEEFALLTIRDYAYTGEIGKPKLPMVTGVIEVPHGADVKLTVVSGDYKEYPLKELGIDKRIVPAFASVPKVKGAVGEFVLDEKTYSSDAYYPDKLADVYIHEGTARGHRLATVEFFPVQYNPVKGTIRFYTSIKVKVEFIGADPVKTEKEIKRNYSPAWEQFIKRMVLNYKPVKDVVPLPIYYDIYYRSGAEAVARKIADWKTQKGFKVRMFNVDGWTASQINDTIRLQSPVATYVLLIGDPNSSTIDVPPSGTGASSGDQTDLYYAEIDESGYLPDLYIGRVSAMNAEEADTAITKAIRYEHADFGSAGYDWLKRACLIAGYDASYQSVGIATNAYCMDNCLIPNGYTVDTLVMASGEEETRVVQQINAGRSWLVYTAHGSRTSWAVGYSGDFNVSELRSQTTNQDMYCLPVGHCCLTGDFDYSSDCFGETWPKIGNRGGISYFGSVPSTYWDEDDWLQRREFDAIYTDSVPGRLYEIARFFQWGLYWIENNTSTSRKQYYFEAYHVFNDPSLDFWTDIPDTMIVTHNPVVVPGTQNFTVTVTDKNSSPLENALVCAWIPSEDPDIHEVDYTDASGEVVLTISPASAGETMYVTVTKHDFFPVFDTVLVVVPASYTIDPESVQVNTPTNVTVTVQDSTNNPYQNVEIHIFGYGVDLYDTTDATGQAILNVDAPYGEYLTVTGRDINETYFLFTDSIKVYGASDLTSWSITATCDTLNVTDKLVPNFPGVVSSTVNPTGYTLDLQGCGIDTSASTSGGALDIDVVPTTTGNVTAAILKPGYNVAKQEIPVKRVKGLVSGFVYEAGSTTPVSGAEIKGYPHGADTSSTSPAFSVNSSADGSYSVSDSVYADYYDVYVKKFGYIPLDTMILVKYGNNTKNLYLTPAPSGIVYGRVYDGGTGNGITATIRIYRTDNDSLYTTVYSDSLNNGDYSVTLPYFDYRFLVTAYHYQPITRVVSVGADSVNEDFKMTPTEGNILVIDDYDGSKGDIWLDIKAKEKVVGHSIEVDVKGVKLASSADRFYRWLIDLGYSVDTMNSAQAVGADWSMYDAVIVSSGNDYNPLRESGLIDKITDWYNGGGKLLVEGGEVGYDYNETDFVRNVLHVDDWDSDNAGDLTLQNASHPLATTPNVLPSTIGISYSAWGDEDAMTLYTGGVLIYGTSSYPNDAGISVFDNTPPPEAGQVIYYGFNLGALGDSMVAKQLVENSISYLLAQETPPNARIYGVVDSRGNPDDGGAIVRATLHSTYGSYYDTTDSGGNYSIDVYPDTYDVYISRDGYSDTLITVYVGDGANVEVNAALYPYVWVYDEDFESGNGGMTSTGDWDWGVPTAGPGGAHSGSNCWGTVLNGNYSNDSDSRLTTPVIDISGASGKLVCEYYQWFYSEGYFDGGNIKVSVDGSNWDIIDPDYPAYNEDAFSSGNAGVPNERGYTGNLGGWSKVKIDLSSYTGNNNLYIRWHFGSDGSVAYDGWYVDDVRIGYPDYSVGVEEIPKEVEVYLERSIGIGGVEVRYGLPKASKVKIKVYDISGRQVYGKEGIKGAGYHSERIELRGAGVYFVRVNAGGRSYRYKLVIF